MTALATPHRSCQKTGCLCGVLQRTPQCSIRGLDARDVCVTPGPSFWSASHTLPTCGPQNKDWTSRRADALHLMCVRYVGRDSTWVAHIKLLYQDCFSKDSCESKVFTCNQHTPYDSKLHLESQRHSNVTHHTFLTHKTQAQVSAVRLGISRYS